jgi:hypothetical protein
MYPDGQTGVVEGAVEVRKMNGYLRVVGDRIRGSRLKGFSSLAIFETGRKGSSPWSWAQAFKKC